MHVGGDLYDVVEGPDADHWGFVVADVCGKGAEAAALTALIRHTVRAELGHGLGPAEVLERLNAAMLRETGGGAGRFATVAHGQLTLTADGATVRLANAGHPPPLVLRDGRVTPVDNPGTLLGVYPDVQLAAVEIELRRGEMMVLYTDGVTEARGVDGFYGAERLAEARRLGGAPFGGRGRRSAAGRRRGLPARCAARRRRDPGRRGGAVTSPSDEPVEVVLTGELDISTFDHAERQVLEAEKSAPALLVIDLGALQFVDSTGVRLILLADQRARAAGRRLAIRLGSGPALRVFEALGLTSRFLVLDASPNGSAGRPKRS